MSISKDQIKNKFVSILGEDNVSTDPVDLISHGYVSKGLEAKYKDVEFKASFLITPRNKDDVIQIVKYCNENKIPIIPRCAATSLAGQVVPVKDNSVLMDFGRHMNKIKEINIEEEFIIVEPGVQFLDIQDELSKYGYQFQAEPGSAFYCQAAGMVGNNASGATSHKYGTTGDFVNHLEVVLANGDVINVGHRSGVVKSVAGYDLVSLFVGSEGTLGIFTEITLKIGRIPKNEITMVVSYSSLDDCWKCVQEIKKEGEENLNIELFEYADSMTLNGINAHFKWLKKRGYKRLKVKKRQGTILIKLVGQDLDKQVKIIEEIANREDLYEKLPKIQIFKEAWDQSMLWKGRHNAGPSIARSMNPPPDPRMYIPMVLDIAVPPNKIINFIKTSKELSSKYGILPITFGHFLDGNVHLIAAITINDETLERAREFQKILLDKVFNEYGGTITAEHGVGLWKQSQLKKEYSEETVDIMRKIKDLFDPNHILNPGKMAVDEIPEIANLEGIGE
ncbi:MAG: FAD-binding protein [Candidatus Lokiarchaeota archaeon]|nr:FAD-binding protein [Candidatus Lokiarchaeota archaeon]